MYALGCAAMILTMYRCTLCFWRCESPYSRRITRTKNHNTKQTCCVRICDQPTILLLLAIHKHTRSPEVVDPYWSTAFMIRILTEPSFALPRLWSSLCARVFLSFIRFRGESWGRRWDNTAQTSDHLSVHDLTPPHTCFAQENTSVLEDLRGFGDI